MTLMGRVWTKYSYDHHAFAGALQDLLQQLPLTQTSVAERTGINRGTVSAILSATRGTPPENRGKLLICLGQAAIEQVDQLPERAQQRLCRTFRRAVRLSDVEIKNVPRLDTMLEVLDQISAHTENPITESIVTHVDLARFAEKQGLWPEAIQGWRLAAIEAEHRGRWPDWAQYQLNAGQAAINLIELALGEDLFGEVLKKPKEDVGVVAHAEAMIRRGWLKFSADDFAGAIVDLEHGLTLLHGLRIQSSSTRLPPREFSAHLASTGGGPKPDLTERGMHFLGRSYVDGGVLTNDLAKLQLGRAWLEEAHAFDQQYQREIDDPEARTGYNVLRQVPALSVDGFDRRPGEYLLDRAHELLQPHEHLPDRGTIAGHLHLHRARLIRNHDDGPTEELFELGLSYNAYRYDNPRPYLSGMARVLRDQTLLVLGREHDNLATLKPALEQILVATLIHPYRQNLDALRATAKRLYRVMNRDDGGFRRHWESLEIEVWSMARSPFIDLKEVVLQFGTDQGIWHLEDALSRARSEVATVVPALATLEQHR